MDIKEIIRKYNIKMIGDSQIGVTAPKNNKNMEELMWIKTHKAEIVEELKVRAAKEERKEAAFKELKKMNPEMKRKTPLTEKALWRVVDCGWDINAANIEYRSAYADIMDGHF